ncbi:MAG: hypothetical protein ACLFST_08975 [Spirochaetia bacterium]
MSIISLKENFDEVKEHFNAWWNHTGLVAAPWGGLPKNGPRAKYARPDPETWYTDYNLRARAVDRQMEQFYPLDSLPIADTNMGPGSLATFIGSEPGFSQETVWFYPSIHNIENPEELPPFEFDPENKWWNLTRNLLSEIAEAGAGRYITGCPDLVENIDVLGSLRDNQILMMDMMERPEWVSRKVFEINRVWFEAYNRIYDIIKLPDGSSAFSAFHLWGPGKTAKVQCDASAMFSPEMFRQFVVPALTEQCEWLDYSLYHLDGTQCICHLDALLEIDALDAVEWTPQAGIEGGADPRWYGMYKKILGAGKSVQIIGVDTGSIQRVLDAVGPEGVYLSLVITGYEDAETAARIIESYRG